jgi:hypothetical protein
VIAKVRKKLAGSKQETQKRDGEIFTLGKLNELVVRKEYQIEITERTVVWSA